MKCSLQGCPGVYEEREVTHTVRSHRRIVVIDHVPALVCDLCGDVVFKADTVRHIERLLDSDVKPQETVPLFEYA